MAINEDVKYTVTLNDMLTGKLQVADSAANKLSGTIGKVEGALSMLGIGAGIAGFAAIGSNIISTISEFEKYDAVLTNTLGSQSASTESLKNLTDLAATTPFAVNELTGAYVKLANMGFKPTMEQMTSLGDLASSTGKGFDQLSEAIIDAQTGEFERLKEFGIRASKNGDKVTFAFKGVKKEVDFTEKSIQKYLLSLGEVEGVSGSMAAISKTTGGQISNLEDNLTSLWLTIGTQVKPVISTMISGLSTLIDYIKTSVTWFKENTTVVKSLAVSVGILSGAYAIYTGWQKLTVYWEGLKNGAFVQSILAGNGLTATMAALNATMLANPAFWVVAGIAAVAGAFYYAYETSETFRAGLFGLWEVVKTVGSLIGEVFTGLGQIIKGALTLDKDAIAAGMLSIVDTVKGAGERIGKSYEEGKEKGVASFKDSKKEKKKGDGLITGVAPMGSPEAAAASAGAPKAPKAPSAQANKAITINVTIGKLIETFKIQTNNMSESTSKIKEMVASTLTDALNDSQIVAGI
jgi:hypothetical protein